MKKSLEGIRDDSMSLCKSLLNTEQQAPENIHFDDDIFKTVCDKLLGNNEARVFKTFRG